jgi:hypothetical protein
MRVTLKGPPTLNTSFEAGGELFTFSAGAIDKEIEHADIPPSLWGYGVEIVVAQSKKSAADKKD